MEVCLNMDGTTAIVLVVGNRFFYGFTKKGGRIQTAWSLPGAKFFASWETKDLETAETRLRFKGKVPERLLVSVRPFLETKAL